MTPKSQRTRGGPAAVLAAGLLLLVPSPALAGGSSYWAGFKRYWGNFFGEVSGVVLVALIVGAVSLFIITRGKWGRS